MEAIKHKALLPRLASLFKNRKYQSEIEALGYQFEPLVMEYFGLFDIALNKLIHECANSFAAMEKYNHTSQAYPQYSFFLRLYRNPADAFKQMWTSIISSRFHEELGFKALRHARYHHLTIAPA